MTGRNQPEQRTVNTVGPLVSNLEVSNGTPQVQRSEIDLDKGLRRSNVPNLELYFPSNNLIFLLWVF